MSRREDERSNGHVPEDGPDIDPELNAEDEAVAEALRRLLFVEEEAIVAALAKGGPATPDEERFLAAAAEELERQYGPASGASKVVETQPAGKILQGPTPAPESPGSRWTFAAAAGFLVAAGIAGGTAIWLSSGDAGTSTTEAATTEDPPEETGQDSQEGPTAPEREQHVYLDGPRETREQVWRDDLDWSAATTGFGFYRLTLFDASAADTSSNDPSAAIEHFDLTEPRWTCPPTIRAKLPEHVIAEVRVIGDPDGAPPLWRQRFSVPR